jgi:polyisoprenoid-binding protein YceI
MNTQHLARITLLSLVLALASCVTPKPTQVAAPPIAVGAPTHPAEVQGARLYRVSAQHSSVHILVYRGGTLASLGHNHVMTSTAINGSVWLGDTVERAGFNIVVPANELIVDDNEARAAEGADFPLNIADDARAGTKRNMLSAALLDGEHYPFVTLKSVAISGALTAPQVTFELTLKDQKRRFTIPVALERNDKQLHVRGEFDFKQTDFGIKPFSAALGALQVQDAVKIKFDLVAVAAQ